MFEQEPYICFNCDAEFSIHTLYETNETVNFCPFCGSEIEGEDESSDEDEEGDWDSLVHR